MNYLSSIALAMLYTVIAEGLVFHFILGKSDILMWARLFFINVASLVMALSIGVMGYFSLGWPFLTSWGAAQWFLLIILCEFLPLAIIFGTLGFRRVFTLLIFANMVSSMLLCFLLVYAPQALLVRSLETSDYEEKVADGIGVIKGALEFYNTNNGQYPGYIYGGDEVSWGKSGGSPDPLLREGYLETYPKNVLNLGRRYFVSRRVPGFVGFFWGEPSEKFKQLESAWGVAVEEDPRFGFKGTRMGNILSDPDIPGPSALYDYHVYRGSAGEEFFLPGAFLYKAFDTNGDGKFDSYILAGFGSEDSAGVDIYNQRDDEVTYFAAGKLVAGKPDKKRDGVIVVETGGFNKWRE